MIHQSSHPEQAILDLISETYLGSNGAQYKLLDGPKRAQNLDNPLFVYLKRHSKVLGNITYCNRPNGAVSENYIRYFAFDSKFQSGDKTNKKKGQNQLKEFFKNQFNSDVFEKSEKFIYYAFIDDENFRSLDMGNQFGFETIGEFTTQIFSKRKPNKKIEIQCFDHSEYLEQLQEVYGKHNFFHPVNLSKGKTYISKKNNKIIHAATFYDTNWEIKSFPGKNGVRKAKLVSKIPFIKDFFKNGKLNFLGMEGLVSNDPNTLNDFLESVLAEEKKKSIMYWYDLKCAYSANKMKKLNPGILGRLSKKVSARIVVKSKKEMVQEYKNKPNYFSAFDVS